ncbi:MAG: hypothetical protein CO094_08615 [Anaerolineae bacterium CG_4_9_14_3_um_filter_57_17]|nr:AAA family ATPase [bacterium]NCT19924.1 AAA family ATPase [bacterium]OIO86001.1 MAG: hypothetical protein AUK01_04600 [Anaerolineae bacterium CG2_30_57_67]PJB65893.1 MAG: hypothetical protein CO094_08615 [Anaerolineae bacterium CG_4_9_14_3_um_filter_57_17]
MSLENSSNKYPEERRLASVLFADVQGFTSLAEQLDFETVSDLIKGIWNRLDRAVEAHNGYIDKHLGDGVMAIWGAPFASDNDAEQAVAAGLELIRALDEFCETTAIPGAEHLKLRVGVNSGLVFAGYVGKRKEYTVIGDTVNLAARLEQIAEADTVVIGESTLRMVRGSFRVRRLEPTQVKGKAEKVQSYAVEGALTAAGRIHYQSAESLETNMVGRNDEIERLLALFKQARQSGSPLMALINGELGIGKSRLLLEFNNQLEALPEELTVLSTRGLSQASHIPYYLWRSLLRNRFGVRDEERVETATQRWQTGVNELYQEAPPDTRLEITQVLGAMIGLRPSADAPAGEENVRRVHFLTREMLRRMSAKHPLILLLDDLQWADRESLQLITYLLNTSEPALPLFIVGAARPDFLKTQSQWHNLARVLHLAPVAFSADLVAQAYPDLHSLPANALAEIGARAEGNPYFLEEIVKSLLKSNLLNAAIIPSEIQARLLENMPESLRATLQARLDNLSREARTVALLASVVGRVFWVGAVLAEARSMPLPGATPIVNIPASVVERFVQDGLRQLIRAELAFPRSGSQFSAEQEYIFKSSYLRDVAYSLLSHRNQAQFHKAVAEWLEQRRDPAYQSMAHDHAISAETAAKASTGSLPAL